MNVAWGSPTAPMPPLPRHKRTSGARRAVARRRPTTCQATFEIGVRVSRITGHSLGDACARPRTSRDEQYTVTFVTQSDETNASNIAVKTTAAPLCLVPVASTATCTPSAFSPYPTLRLTVRPDGAAGDKKCGVIRPLFPDSTGDDIHRRHARGQIGLS